MQRSCNPQDSECEKGVECVPSSGQYGVCAMECPYGVPNPGPAHVCSCAYYDENDALQFAACPPTYICADGVRGQQGHGWSGLPCVNPNVNWPACPGVGDPAGSTPCKCGNKICMPSHVCENNRCIYKQSS